MLHLEGFVLGLSTGIVCLGYCGPVLIPYLMGENSPVRQNYHTLFLFLGGRFFAYLVTGGIAGMLGMAFQKSFLQDSIFAGVVFLLLSLLMIYYGFHRFREICLGSFVPKIKAGYLERWPFLMPAIGGLLTGFNLCPPFLLAFAKAFESRQFLDGILLFLWFFMGTSIYFLPLPLIGFARKKKTLQVIGKFAAILAGFYYFYISLIMLFH